MKTVRPSDLDALAEEGLSARDLDDLLNPEDARFPIAADPLAFLGDES